MDIADNIDQVIATISNALTDFVENLALVSSNTINNEGNALNYTVIGNAGLTAEANTVKAQIGEYFSKSLGRAATSGDKEWYAAQILGGFKTNATVANDIACSLEAKAYKIAQEGNSNLPGYCGSQWGPH